MSYSLEDRVLLTVKVLVLLARAFITFWGALAHLCQIPAFSESQKLAVLVQLGDRRLANFRFALDVDRLENV